MFGADSNTPCSGEGLMLWHQDMPWSMRGNTSRTTNAILKYKPKAITVGVVTSLDPEHTHRIRNHKRTQLETEDNDEDDDQIAGYTGSINWWDNMQGLWVPLRPYIPASYTAGPESL